MKKQKIEFLKLNNGESIDGTFVGFGKNRYGIFIKIKVGKETKGISVNGSVIRNLLKTNLDKLIEKEGEAIVSITREGNVPGKKYILYSLSIDGIECESSNNDLTAFDMKTLFD